jgi:hypothetical protein
MRLLWERYGLGIVLFAMWMTALGLHGYGEWAQATWCDLMEEIPWWLAWYTTATENLASEFAQLFTFVVLSKYLRFIGSPQSRDGSDDIQATLDEILVRLDRIEQARNPNAR